MKKRPDNWPPLGLGPHISALLLANNSFAELNCTLEKLPDPSCASVDFPTLEELICSILFRADNPDAPYPKRDSCPEEDVAGGFGPWVRGAAYRVGTFFEFWGRQFRNG